MGKVTIMAKTGNVYVNDKKLSGSELAFLDGLDCQDEFVEYIHNKSLKDKLNSGYMKFKFEKGILYTVTTYETNVSLDEDELDELGDYTQGQWSDGIGEGFEQTPCEYLNDEEVYVSPWYSGQQLDIIQE